jgi:hypothetical protein
MKNTNVLEEINEMKYLFDYRRGKVISEQESSDVTDFVVGGTQSVSVGPTTPVAPTASITPSTTTKTTRKATGLEVQKLLNTKFSTGLKEDGRVGPLTLGAIMNALEGSSGSSAGTSTGVSTTPTTTVAGGSVTSTTTVAGSTTQTPTAAASGGGGIDPNVVGQEFNFG